MVSLWRITSLKIVGLKLEPYFLRSFQRWFIFKYSSNNFAFWYCIDAHRHPKLFEFLVELSLSTQWRQIVAEKLAILDVFVLQIFYACERSEVAASVKSSWSKWSYITKFWLSSSSMCAISMAHFAGWGGLDWCAQFLSTYSYWQLDRVYKNKVYRYEVKNGNVENWQLQAPGLRSEELG